MTDNLVETCIAVLTSEPDIATARALRFILMVRRLKKGNTPCAQ